MSLLRVAVYVLAACALALPFLLVGAPEEEE